MPSQKMIAAYQPFLGNVEHKILLPFQRKNRFAYPFVKIEYFKRIWALNRLQNPNAKTEKESDFIGKIFYQIESSW